ncbi:MAG: hypothetical protein ABFE02_12790 [Sulfuricella sp.]
MNSDQARLQEDQRLLQQDQARLTQLQRQTRVLQQTQTSQALQTGVDRLTHNAPSTTQASPPTVNTSGQVVGQVVNVVA